jgi:small subunit ribosomal protein S5
VVEKSIAVKPVDKTKTTGKEDGSTPKKTVAAGKTVYAQNQKKRQDRRPKRGGFNKDRQSDEFEQRIVDIARVTRVMAGGKRMRFRACVAIGNKKGKVAIGLAKGADVTIAITKAVNKAKKEMIEVPIVNDTIPHEIYWKKGAAKVLLKPGSKGRGVIAGGAVRIILELAGVRNVTSKILGTNNKVNIVKCTIEALDNLKKIERKASQKNKKAKKQDKVNGTAREGGQDQNKKVEKKATDKIVKQDNKKTKN